MGKHHRDAVLYAVFHCTDIEDASYSCRAGGLNPYGDLPLVLPILRGGRKDLVTPITKSSLYIGERFSVPFSDPSHNYNRRDLVIPLTKSLLYTGGIKYI